MARKQTSEKSRGKKAATSGEAVPWWLRPPVGNALTLVAGFAFMFVCMLLPLVGQAGVAVPYAKRNFQAFLWTLLLSLALAAAAAASKHFRSRLDGSPRPWLSYTLLAVNAALLLALVAGLLKI